MNLMDCNLIMQYPQTFKDGRKAASGYTSAIFCPYIKPDPRYYAWMLGYTFRKQS